MIAAERHTHRVAKVMRALDGMNASRERRAFHVPGRIEVLGKHTDYAGGRSLLCAVERGFVVAVGPRADNVILIENADDGSRYSSDAARKAPGWWRYASTVTERTARDFPRLRLGADIALSSDLPPDSGLSSSSALVVALFLALDAVRPFRLDERYRNAIPNDETLAEYLGAVENGRPFGPLQTEGGGGVGTHGGSEDHTAILCCRADTLSRYAFCPVRFEGMVPMPSGHVFVIAFSGVAAAKTGNALAQYNEASIATQEIVRLWNGWTYRNDATIGDALAAVPDAAARLRDIVRSSEPRGFTTARLSDRLEQFLVESCDITPQAFDALRNGDLAVFGRLVEQSQTNAERWLGNQTRETITLVRQARALGAVAASAFGAGFGGSVWAMVREDSADACVTEWRDAYAAEFPVAAQKAIFFITRAANGAAEIPLGDFT
jgi:galactokinase